MVNSKILPRAGQLSRRRIRGQNFAPAIYHILRSSASLPPSPAVFKNMACRSQYLTEIHTKNIAMLASLSGAVLGCAEGDTKTMLTGGRLEPTDTPHSRCHHDPKLSLELPREVACPRQTFRIDHPLTFISSLSFITRRLVFLTQSACSLTERPISTASNKGQGEVGNRLTAVLRTIDTPGPNYSTWSSKTPRASVR